MIDAKILGVSLIALLILGIGLSGTAGGEGVESGLADILTQTDLGSIFNGFMSIFDGETDSKLETNVSFQLNDNQTHFEVQNSTVESKGLNNFTVDGVSIQSEEPVTLDGFSGSFYVRNQSADVVGSSRSAVSESFEAGEIDSFESSDIEDKIEINNREPTDLKFDKVVPEISTEDGASELRNPKELKIDSFVGEIVLEPRERNFRLSGNVTRVEAGSYQVEG